MVAVAKGIHMHSKRLRSNVKHLALIVCALLFSFPAFAQEAGGDLGGGSGIFRPKNPETRSPRRTKVGPARPKTANARTSGKKAEEIEAQIEDLLDEGNEARDAKKFAQAETAYKSALKLGPKNWRAAYGLGNIYTDEQRWEEAEQSYRQASQWNASDADTYLALSYVLLQPRSGGSQAKRLAEAETSARRVIELQPNNAVAYDRLGAALEARGLFGPETEQAYRKAIELDPQFAPAYVHLARLIRRDAKRKAEAEPLYGRALELAKDPPTLILIADALQSEQRYHDSERPLRAALEIDPSNPSALFLLGRMFVVLKKFDDGIAPLQKAIEVSPRSFSPYEVLGSAYLQSQKYPEAELVFGRAVELASPASRKRLAGPFGFEGVADGYLATGRASDAVRVYEVALKLDPQNPGLQKKLTDANSKSR
jgi:tetratricopeptide (TPR) repeat protein